MSDLKVTTISDLAGTGPVTLTKQSASKAWVNFDGTGTAAINDSFNVASAVDGGTGSYAMNFSSIMSNSKYTVTSIDSRNGLSTGGNRSIQGAFAVAAGSYGISNVYDASVFDDGTLMMQINGDLA